jgi:FtsP/CotA-like multicopper oxidase with cupredoxin domain
MRHCLLPLLSSLLLAACSQPRVADSQGGGTLAANDNRSPAGTRHEGVLALHLEIAEGDWQAERALPVWRLLAFAEAGRPASTPGPLIRATQGTIVDVQIENRSGDALSIHGLHTRPGIDAPLFIASHGTAHARFSADAAGTFYYWGTLGRALDEREGRDSELIGALIIDPPGGRVDDRIFIITRHGGQDEGGDGVGAWAINGRSWPQTERLSYHVGEPVHWRWINATGHPHPMHLHGAYFRVTSSGDNSADLPRAPGEQNEVVTQRMPYTSTMAMSWVPLHAGNWLFHCHILVHVMPENRIPEPQWYDDYTTLPHDEHMAGLVLGIHVHNEGVAENSGKSAPPRSIQIRVAERPGVNFDDYYKRPVPGVGYAIDGSPVSAPGPALVLERGRPVAITIHNTLTHATSVHWHGIEVQSSYDDGVPHWGVDGDRVTPWIDPGSSFVAHFTPPRAGTFMYHTHFNDYAQLTAGLYGALLVVEPGQTLDATIDHTYVIGQGPDEEKDPILLNGATELPPATWRAGSSHRVRLVGMTASEKVHVRLARDGQAVTWRALAKDGADLPAALATLRAAEVDLSPGETWDFAYAAEQRGTLRLEAALPGTQIAATSAAISVE